jgi:hypothetical protein
MNGLCVVLAVVASMLLVACASHANKAAGGADRREKVTASGYTQEGCLLNLKLEARERNGRLLPDDVEVERNTLMLFFPFLNQEGYQCSGSFVEREKRPSGRDPFYPFD